MKTQGVGRRLAVLGVCLFVALSPALAKHHKGGGGQAEDIGKPPEWKGGNIVGLTFQLEDPKKVESLTFSRGGQVLMITGSRGGKLATPTYFWDWDTGQLRVTNEQQELYDEFSFVSRDATTIVLRRHNGDVVKYKLIPNKGA